MRTNILYITHCKKEESSGVWKKIKGQTIGILQNNPNSDVFLVYTENNMVVCSRILENGMEDVVHEKLFSEGHINLKRKSFMSKIIYKFKRYFDYAKMFKIFLDIVYILLPRLIYIRAITPYTPYHISFLKAIRHFYNTKIFWEIPTYPVRKEFLMSKEYVSYLGDIVFFKSIKILVDKIIVISLGKEKDLPRNKFIHLSNGIDMGQCKHFLPRAISREEISIVCVANYRDWHGYDRLLVGLSNYYKNTNSERCIKNIKIHFVGNGMEKLESFATKLHLQDKAQFYGPRYGEDLDQIYSNADLAVATLGMYRKNLYRSSDLKIREYMSMGLPYISCCEDIDVPIDYRYKLVVPNDHSAIDFEEVIKFYLTNCFEKQFVKKDIRDFAKKIFSWQQKMYFTKI